MANTPQSMLMMVVVVMVMVTMMAVVLRTKGNPYADIGPGGRRKGKEGKGDARR